MHNDSIETLLLRHYGRIAPGPAGLEQQLVAAVHERAREQDWQNSVAMRLRNRRISRRRVVRLVAIASAGAGILSVGVESLRTLEAALGGQDATQPARPAFS